MVSSPLGVADERRRRDLGFAPYVIWKRQAQRVDSCFNAAIPWPTAFREVAMPYSFRDSLFVGKECLR